ncbi:protein STRUBBELIG-RECEPTOR FAMILY 8-like [Canna indica]|uniref:Protein STRUBBELIG-RECEPTOR FAMILY 8-like n=1 Tax=Canna indica TaxID=4628 RepID=A0AAQ3KRR2_9LILI|nr:protein STRUBBELIG-RECEPTOR FAMILY 8-like [Canna indica]
MTRSDRCPAALAALLDLVPLLLFSFLAVMVESATDSLDVQALGVLYSSLNSPPQLSGWTPSGGDPCGHAWKGITCSGSVITVIQLPGLGLNGSMGYLLSDLLSLKTLDLSNNYIHESIPYQLPPNLTYLNLAGNHLSGNLPYSISTMVSLNYLNLSHNMLSETIGDLFRDLQNFAELDLSFNNFTGDLPTSFGSLSNLSSLYLQNNGLTGPVNILANIDLTTLNIANNQFSGWIPPEFNSILNLVIEGNSFSTGPAPPPPPYMPPPPRRPRRHSNNTQEPANTPPGCEAHPDLAGKKSLTAGSVKGIAIGSAIGGLCILLAVILYLKNAQKGKHDSLNSSNDSGRSDGLAIGRVTAMEIEQQILKSSSVTSLNPPDKVIIEKSPGQNVAAKWPKVPISATSYTVASLQVATNSFSQDSLVGEGSLGRVYRAEFPNGKVLAVKKIESAATSLQEEDNFLGVVSNISRLRHPNIVAFSGYCAEHGQRLLVYEYIGSRTLHDMLHHADDSSKMLSWNSRMRIALGTARALEYMHEVCRPSVVHRNLKSTNILLDEELNPHLSDCGLAALTPNTERQVSAEIVGSFGYSAPEFAMSGVYTVKSDVYSFGVVMLELLTGRKPLDSSRVRSEQSLVRWATPQLHDIDAISKMVDPAMNGIYPAKSLSRFADIIVLCVQPEPEFRPPMSQVVQEIVRLAQRTSIVKRRSGDEFGFSHRVSEQDPSTADASF